MKKGSKENGRGHRKQERRNHTEHRKEAIQNRYGITKEEEKGEKRKVRRQWDLKRLWLEGPEAQPKPQEAKAEQGVL